MCDDFGVVHRHDDRRHESGGAEHCDPRSDSCEHCRDQHTKRQDGNERGEWRHCSACPRCGCEASVARSSHLPRLRRGTRPRQHAPSNSTSLETKSQRGVNRLTLMFSGSSTWARTRDLRLLSPSRPSKPYQRGLPIGLSCWCLLRRRKNGRSAGRKWQKWQMREGEGIANRRGSTPVQQRSSCMPLWTHPLKENPLFPLRCGASYGSDQHGLICGYAFDGTRGGRDIGLNDAVKWLAAHSLADDEGFLWLHFNLADASAERWIRTNSGAAGRILRVSACGVALDAHRTDWGQPDRRRQ